MTLADKVRQVRERFNLEDDNEIATPGKTQEPSEQEVKQSEVRSMGGYKSIEDVAKAAPSEETPRESSKEDGRRSKRDRPLTKRERESAKEEDKEKRRRAAMENAGRRYCKLLADIPYNMWAKFVNDNYLALTKAESEELAQSYFDFAQSLDPDLTSPWVLGFALIIQNGMLIIPRVAHLKEMEEKHAKMEKAREQAVDAEIVDEELENEEDEEQLQ